MANRGQTPEFSGEREVETELERDTNAKLPNSVEDEITQGDQHRLKKIGAPEQSDTDQNTQNFDTRVHGKKVGPPAQAGEIVDRDPGERQKENQNNEKDDSLAA